MPSQYTVELLPSHKDGLANLVERLQVDGRPETRAAYQGYPELSRKMRATSKSASSLHRKEPGACRNSAEFGEVLTGSGIIDPYPEFVHATLLILEPPLADGGSDALVKRICDQFVAPMVKQDFVQLSFNGKPKPAKEGERTVWRIDSYASDKIKLLRERLIQIFKGHDFEAWPPARESARVHISIRGRWPNTGAIVMPTDESPIPVLFEKLAVTPAAEHPGDRKPCGLTWKHNLGSENMVRSLCSSRVADFSSEFNDTSKFPALNSSARLATGKHASRRSGGKTGKRANDANVGRIEGHIVQHVDKDLLEDLSFPDVLQMQDALTSSIEDADTLAATDNAPVSDALLRSKKANSVSLYELSRAPTEVQRAFAASPTLRDCIQTLKLHEFDLASAGEATIFVLPSEFEAVVRWIRFEKFEPKRWHVFASAEFHAPMIEAVMSIRCKDKVKSKKKYIVPMNFIHSIEQGQIPAIKFRTFIHIPTPSSLRSGPASGLVVASTTDAHGIGNPRKA